MASSNIEGHLESIGGSQVEAIAGRFDMMRKTLTVIAAGLFVLAFAPRTEALTLTFDTVFSGNTPNSTSPYLTATFTDAGANTVNVTLQGSLENSSEFFSDIEFNLDPNLPLGTLTLNYGDSDATQPAFSYGTDIDQADGDGLYDVLFSFQTASGAGQFEGRRDHHLHAAVPGRGNVDRPVVQRPVYACWRRGAVHRSGARAGHLAELQRLDRPRQSKRH
jgi:hypothetical protein